MKKTLVALCVAAGMVGTASATDVQLYGLINTGLGYVHTHSDVAGVANTDTLSMENGQEFGSRWGLRGGENLGNGYKVSFVLESGFESDTGLSDTKQNGRLFGREASISVSLVAFFLLGLLLVAALLGLAFCFLLKLEVAELGMLCW